MKFTNISRAWLSTLIGVLITVLGTVATSYAAGEFSWSTLVTFAVPSLLLAVTDVLKEVKRDIDRDQIESNTSK